MPDVRPFRALRYDTAVAGDPSTLLAPPYDVIGPEEQRRLYDASPHNIVRIEYGEDRPGDAPGNDRYARAASELAAWRRSGVLVQHPEPRFYLYEQTFVREGQRTRRALLAAVRLEPWEADSIRPHERTLAKPKEDRLRLLRAVRANVSPVFGLYPGGDDLAERLTPGGAPLLDASTPDGQRHRLYAFDEALSDSLSAAFENTTIYIADGHHRYETALAYRDEARAAAGGRWTGDEAENFVLMALVASDDPGLCVLPIHRLLHPPAVPHDLLPRLSRFFDIDDVTPRSWDGTALTRLRARLSAAGREGVAFGALGLEEQRYHLLRLSSYRSVESLMPTDKPAAWRHLDVAVLQSVVLKTCLGIDESAVAAGDVVTFTEDAAQAQAVVESGRARLAFLLNPTPVERIFAVADAGERMPQKSTFFYPKLATGLALYAFD